MRQVHHVRDNLPNGNIMRDRWLPWLALLFGAVIPVALLVIAWFYYIR